MEKMKLWLFKNEVLRKDFAEALDICPQHLGSVLSGRLRCGKKLARKMERQTNGDVKASDVRDDMPRARKPRKEKLKQMDIKDFGKKLEAIKRIENPDDLPPGWGK